MLDSRVLSDQQLHECMQQRFAPLSGVMHKLEETEVKSSFSCEMPRCGRSQLRNSDQKPSIVFTWTSQKPSPSSSRVYSPRPWLTLSPMCLGHTFLEVSRRRRPGRLLAFRTSSSSVPTWDNRSGTIRISGRSAISSMPARRRMTSRGLASSSSSTPTSTHSG
jgi:hypothetical protein